MQHLNTGKTTFWLQSASGPRTATATSALSFKLVDDGGWGDGEKGEETISRKHWTDGWEWGAGGRRREDWAETNRGIRNRS